MVLFPEDAMSATKIAVSGVIGHLLFNRLEPRSLPAIFALLLGPPTVLPFILSASHGGILSGLLSSYIVYLGALVCSVVVYRLSPFHPLASFPGPIICKVTRLWAWYIARSGSQHLYYKSLHARYGTHVRTGPNHLLVADVEAIPAIMGAKGFPRGARYTIATPPGTTGSLFSITDLHEHAQRRRIWDRSLNTTAVQGYQDVLARRITQLCSMLEKQRGVVDLSSWLSYFSFDFMGDLAFGGAFTMMEQGFDAGDHMRTARISAGHIDAAGAIPWVKPFLGLLPNTEILRNHRQFAKDSVLARKAKGSTRKDIFYYLLDEEGVGSGPPSIPTLVVESGLAIVAGSDTTGTALSNLFFYLISNPKVMNRLRAEVDSTFPPGSDVCVPAVLGEMEFLNAVINETLRIQPAVPNGVQRVIPRDSGGAMIAGRWVPSCSTVQVPTYTVHRDPRYFSPDPDPFRPERWISELPGDYKLEQAAYIPFSFGPMNCAGKNLALQELRMVTCALLQRFEFDFVPGWDAVVWEKNLLDWFVLAKGALPVHIKARN